MQRDRNFWVDVFKKSPLIGAIMALGGIVGCGLGIYWFGAHFNARAAARVVLVLLAGTTCGGIFIGLVVGVVIDSIVGMFRKDKNKRRPPDDHYRRY